MFELCIKNYSSSEIIQGLLWYPESGYLRHQYGPPLLTTDGRANIQAQQGDGSPFPIQIEKGRKVGPHRRRSTWIRRGKRVEGS